MKGNDTVKSPANDETFVEGGLITSLMIEHSFC